MNTTQNEFTAKVVGYKTVSANSRLRWEVAVSSLHGGFVKTFGRKDAAVKCARAYDKNFSCTESK